MILTERHHLKNPSFCPRTVLSSPVSSLYCSFEREKEHHRQPLPWTNSCSFPFSWGFTSCSLLVRRSWTLITFCLKYCFEKNRKTKDGRSLCFPWERLQNREESWLWLWSPKGIMESWLNHHCLDEHRNQEVIAKIPQSVWWNICGKEDRRFEREDHHHHEEHDLSNLIKRLTRYAGWRDDEFLTRYGSFKRLVSRDFTGVTTRRWRTHIPEKNRTILGI